MTRSELALSIRQELILRRLVEAYVADGHPVGSKTLVTTGAVVASSSTVRYELAELEELGLLNHPHTSAGRVPTDVGYRYYAEMLLRSNVEASPLPVNLSLVQRELESALHATAEALSAMTNLLAAVSAPALDTTVVRHVELLLLQPQVLLAVVITATGGVTKRLFVFDDTVDQGLVDWAADYFEETVVGLNLGARVLRQKLSDASLGERERTFLQTLAPLFTDLTGQGNVYVGGAAGLVGGLQARDVESVRQVVAALEERHQLLEALRDARISDRPLVRIGDDVPVPELRSLALVATSYGLAGRNLGTVAVVGPRRMDYGAAIASVRGAAAALSEFVEDLYG